MKNNSFSIISRLKSFAFAFNGVRILIEEEHNARIHLIAGVVVVAMGLILDISRMEWIAITFSIGLVIILETINSAIENISDFISPEKNHIIKKIKDLSAAAVLIIFIPKIM